MMESKHQQGKIKWQLWEFECDNCDTGIVQIHDTHKRGGLKTTEVSGCLNCKKDFGIKQALNLKPLK